MSLLQVTSCPAQPCLTLAQLREQFFVHDDSNEDYFETAVVGNTELIFLPGTHVLDYSLSFFSDGGSPSLSGPSNRSNLNTIMGYNSPAVTVNNFSISFVDIAVTITHLRFADCFVYGESGDRLIMDHIKFDDTQVILEFFGSVSVTNTNVTVTAAATIYYCSRNVRHLTSGGVSFLFSHVSLRNVLFVRDHSPCGNGFSQLHVSDGSLDIADSAFLGKRNHVSIRANCHLTVSGTVRFENANAAIQVSGRSTVRFV